MASSAGDLARSLRRSGAAALIGLLCLSTGVAAAPSAGIASAHPLASEAGEEILAEGGNAFDAAVAVSSVLAVVEPYSSGLGGGGFYLLHRASDGRQVMVDGRETAPAEASPDMYLDADGELVRDRSRQGGLAAAIPGTPAALVHIAQEYGELALGRSLAPAIRLAREGFSVDRRFAAMTRRYRDRLFEHCEPDCIFLDQGQPLEAGHHLRQPELARTLEALAEDSGRSFYRGEIARRLVEGVRRAGGIWSLEDLSGYRVREREPVMGEYAGHRIIAAGPPSSGGTTLIQTLNILSGYALDETSSPRRAHPRRVHLIAEAWRRSYRDRNEYLGDPDFVDLPIARLTDPDYAAGLRAGIRPDRATPSELLPPVVEREEGRHTSHFSIIDAERNRVAATQTVNLRFGSGVMPAGTGVILNDEMDDFSAKPGEPNAFGLVQGRANAVAPGKRPLSSMTPSFIEGPRGVAILGTPGGSRIISMVTLAVLDYVAGGDAGSMVSLPRFHHQYLPDRIQYEAGALEPSTVCELEAMGHHLEQTSYRFGNMNVVTWDRETGAVEAATDPRNEAYVDF